MSEASERLSRKPTVLSKQPPVCVFSEGQGSGGFQDIVMEVQSCRGLRSSDPGFRGQGGKEQYSQTGAVKESLAGLCFLI